MLSFLCYWLNNFVQIMIVHKRSFVQMKIISKRDVTLSGWLGSKHQLTHPVRSLSKEAFQVFTLSLNCRCYHWMKMTPITSFHHLTADSDAFMFASPILSSRFYERQVSGVSLPTFMLQLATFFLPVIPILTQTHPRTCIHTDTCMYTSLLLTYFFTGWTQLLHIRKSRSI